MDVTSGKVREISCVVSAHDICGEGVVWHPEEDALYWTDINRRLLHRYRLADTRFETWQFEQPVTAVALTSNPALILVVLGGSIILWDTTACCSVATLFQLPAWPGVRCNDARVGPDGMLWFGTMQNNVRSDGGSVEITDYLGELLSLERSGKTCVWHSGMGIMNTVAWSPSGERLFFGDTLRNCIYSSDFYCTSSTISAPALFAEGFLRGLPDGSAMDADGYLWNCRYGGGCIVRFAPDGALAEVIDTSVKNPTTCAFGGPDYKTLYFTSAAASEDGEAAPGGALFCLEVEVPGLPSYRFEL
ncbi:SMP-30/gluconolactonase/LRE family protein [Silvibacterium dinghuense]|nr:SMP-30/gluconolactonase/LRE family protein [Silvibacterium dinghuense]GGH06509.1 senescence marker protein-30 (SMP-30) family protein [Silvibacterium dinghuense]